MGRDRLTDALVDSQGHRGVAHSNFSHSKFSLPDRIGGIVHDGVRFWAPTSLIDDAWLYFDWLRLYLEVVLDPNDLVYSIT